MSKRLIAIDPSEWGAKTSGTGFAWCDFEFPQVNHLCSYVVFGKYYQDQEQYNKAVLEFLEGCVTSAEGREPIVVVEEYVNFNKGAHQFKVNRTSEMIGVIKQKCLTLGVEVITKNSAQIKGLTKMILEYQELIKDNETPLTMEYKNGKLKGVEWGNRFVAKHDFDAYRHLILLIQKEIKNYERK